MVKLAQFSDINDNQNAIARAARNIVINGEPSFVAGEQKKIEELRAKNTAILAALGKTVTLPKAVELLKVINDNRGAYNAGIDQAIALALKGERAAAGALLVGDVRAKQNVVFNAVRDSTDLQRVVAQRLADDAAKIASFGTMLMIGWGAWWLRSVAPSAGCSPGRFAWHWVPSLASSAKRPPASPKAISAGQTMGEIVGSIKRVSDIVAEISSASVEQSSGISQVGDAVSQMDQVTQQNAALVEESAAAAESLRSQAQQLVETVAVFKLAPSERGGMAVPLSGKTCEVARQQLAPRASCSPTTRPRWPVPPVASASASAARGSCWRSADQATRRMRPTSRAPASVTAAEAAYSAP